MRNIPVLSRLNLVCLLCVSWAVVPNAKTFVIKPRVENLRAVLQELYESQRQTDRSPSSNDDVTGHMIHKRKNKCLVVPCMFNNMGISAGEARQKNFKMQMLRECLSDPYCYSVGKRSLLDGVNPASADRKAENNLDAPGESSYKTDRKWMDLAHYLGMRRTEY